MRERGDSKMKGCTSKESERLHLEGKDSKGREPFEGCTSEERRCTSREDCCTAKEQTLHLKGKEVALERNKSATNIPKMSHLSLAR